MKSFKFLKVVAKISSMPQVQPQVFFIPFHNIEYLSGTGETFNVKLKNGVILGNNLDTFTTKISLVDQVELWPNIPDNR